jgi:large subunit ribosomal protein L25
VSDRPRLAATSRTVTGKAVARLRHEGLLPAVVFGHGTASEPVSLDAHEFDRLRRHVGASTLVDLSVDGKKPRPVILHGVQMHKVTHRPLHVDLFAVRMTEELTAEVPLVGDGMAPAASELGGTLVHPLSSVKVRALPGDLPEAIHYDLSPLATFDHVITVGDLTAPHGVVIQAEPSEVIARVLAPRVEEVPVAEAAEVAEAAAAEPAAPEETTAEG